MNAVKKTRIRTVPAATLLKISRKAKEEHSKADEMFHLLGWSSLPAELKLAIEDDVKAYYYELHGRYSTNCAYVQRRRESVDFWVRSFLDGICSLETALDSVRITKL